MAQRYCATCVNYRVGILDSPITSLPKSAHSYCVLDSIELLIDESTPACLMHQDCTFEALVDQASSAIGDIHLAEELNTFLSDSNDMASLTYKSFTDAVKTIVSRAEATSRTEVRGALTYLVDKMRERFSIALLEHTEELKRDIAALKEELQQTK